MKKGQTETRCTVFTICGMRSIRFDWPNTEYTILRVYSLSLSSYVSLVYLNICVFVFGAICAHVEDNGHAAM